MRAATLPEYRLIRTSDNTVLDRVRMSPEEAAMRNTEYQQAGYPLGETPVLGYDRDATEGGTHLGSISWLRGRWPQV